jgi:hypothetical protein
MGKKGNPFKKILEPIKKGVLFVKCWVRIITNFPKCITFYVLDYLKFVFLFVPLFLVSVCTGQGKAAIKRNHKTLADALKWSPGILYDCYVCKKPKKKKALSFWEKIKQAILGGGSKGMSFVFFLVMGVLLIALYFISFMLPNENPPTPSPT